MATPPSVPTKNVLLLLASGSPFLILKMKDL